MSPVYVFTMHFITLGGTPSAYDKSVAVPARWAAPRAASRAPVQRASGCSASPGAALGPASLQSRGAPAGAREPHCAGAPRATPPGERESACVVRGRRRRPKPTSQSLHLVLSGKWLQSRVINFSHRSKSSQSAGGT